MTSAARAADLPRDGRPHVAMVGRSNVGKSSLINALVRQRIARTSAAPGKTRLINLYRVRCGPGTDRGRLLYLVDLPGYGYAHAPRPSRDNPGSAEGRRHKAASEFKALLEDYFAPGAWGGGPGASQPAALLLVDARHPGLANDLAAHEWLAGRGLPYGVVTTKIDQLTRAERRSAQRTFETELKVPVLPVSAVTGEGLDDLWKLILRLCNDPAAAPTPPPSSSPR